MGSAKKFPADAAGARREGRRDGWREGREAFVTHFEVMMREKEISAGTGAGEGRDEGGCYAHLSHHPDGRSLFRTKFG